MSNALLFRMASGIPGDISRRQFSIVDSQLPNVSKPFSAYGRPGKMVAGKFEPIENGDTAANVEGFLVRPYPTQTANADGAGISIGKIVDRMLQGYMTVHNYAGTPAIDGQVYMRVAGADADHPIGAIEAADSHTNVGAATGGNTGDGTIGTVSTVATAQTGVYTATMTAATTFAVTAPDGTQLKAGATGAAYAAGGVTFTITVGATPMIAGDSFTVTVARATVPIANCKFTCAADASGNVEIQFNL